MWYVSSNRDETRYEDPDRFDVTRNPEHQAFGAGGRHFCLGTALARLELRILFEETLARFPEMELAGEPSPSISAFLNQLKTLPVSWPGGLTLAAAPLAPALTLLYGRPMSPLRRRASWSPRSWALIAVTISRRARRARHRAGVRHRSAFGHHA